MQEYQKLQLLFCVLCNTSNTNNEIILYSNSSNLLYSVVRALVFCSDNIRIIRISLCLLSEICNTTSPKFNQYDIPVLEFWIFWLKWFIIVVLCVYLLFSGPLWWTHISNIMIFLKMVLNFFFKMFQEM